MFLLSILPKVSTHDDLQRLQIWYVIVIIGNDVTCGHQTAFGPFGLVADVNLSTLVRHPDSAYPRDS
jgi:hypothetical protein